MVLTNQSTRILLFFQNRFWNAFIIFPTIATVAETPGFHHINASDPEPIATVSTIICRSPRGIRAAELSGAVLLFVHTRSINFNGSPGTEASRSAHLNTAIIIVVFTTIGTSWSTFKVHLVTAASLVLSVSY